LNGGADKECSELVDWGSR